MTFYFFLPIFSVVFNLLFFLFKSFISCLTFKISLPVLPTFFSWHARLFWLWSLRLRRFLLRPLFSYWFLLLLLLSSGRSCIIIWRRLLFWRLLLNFLLLSWLLGLMRFLFRRFCRLIVFKDLIILHKALSLNFWFRWFFRWCLWCTWLLGLLLLNRLFERLFFVHNFFLLFSKFLFF